MNSKETLKIDGVTYEILDRLSSGPGEIIHTYVLTDGAYLEWKGGEWILETRDFIKCPRLIFLPT